MHQAEEAAKIQAEQKRVEKQCPKQDDFPGEKNNNHRPFQRPLGFLRTRGDSALSQDSGVPSQVYSALPAPSV